MEIKIIKEIFALNKLVNMVDLMFHGREVEPIPQD